MVNILPRAYFSEFFQLCCAVTAWFFVVTMVFSTGLDLLKAIDARKGGKWSVPVSLLFQGKGYFTAELWRLIETTLLVGIGIWSIFHSIDSNPVEFWNLEDNLRADRVIMILITVCKMNAAITARYFRHRANIADGIQHD